MSSGSSLSQSQKLMVPILTVLLLLSLLLLIKDYYFNSSFYNPDTGNEAQINSLLSKDSLLKFITNNNNINTNNKINPTSSSSAHHILSPRQQDINNCNDQGFYYTDINECQCFSCFSGADCSTFDQDCIIDDGGGNPLLFQEYWRNNTIQTTIEAIYYRTPYQQVTLGQLNISNTSNTSSSSSSTHQFHSSAKTVTPTTLKATSSQGYLYPYLVDSIGSIHKYINNIANINNKYVVFGHGCTELIAASMYACNKLYGNGRTSYVYAKIPYYQGYPSRLNLGIQGLEFSTNDSINGEEANIIEFVTYPNNPTNTYRKPTYDGSKGKGNTAGCTIYDQVYWWPSISNFSDGGAPLDTQVSLFSFSKITGHAGSRFGWALIDDEQLANEMGNFIYTVQGAVSIDTQNRAYDVFNMLMSDADQYNDNNNKFKKGRRSRRNNGMKGGNKRKENDGDDVGDDVGDDKDKDKDSVKNIDLFFEWVRNELDERWDTLNGIFNASTSGKFIQQANPGAFYAWIKCTDNSKTCYEQFEAGGIGPVDGTSFGADSSYVRLELVTATSVWNIVVQRLKTLIV